MRLHPTRALKIAAAVAAFGVLAGAAGAAEPSAPGFKQDVLPILEQHCIQCHAPGEIGFQSIGLNLTSYRGLMDGSRHGPTVIPRQPQLGSLMKVLDWKKDYYTHMPAMGHQLPKQDLETIRAWIAAGAKND